MSHFLLSWIAAVPAFAAPFLLATTGLIINERAGVLNLGSLDVPGLGATIEPDYVATEPMPEAAWC